MSMRKPLLILGLSILTSVPVMAGQMGLTLPKPITWIFGYATTTEGVHITTAKEMAKRVNLSNVGGQFAMTFRNSYVMGAIYDIEFRDAGFAAVNFLELLSGGEVSAVRTHHLNLDYRDICFTIEGVQLLTDQPYKRNISGRSLDHVDSIATVGPDECDLNF